MAKVYSVCGDSPSERLRAVLLGALVNVYEVEGVGMDTAVWLSGDKSDAAQVRVGTQTIVALRELRFLAKLVVPLGKGWE